MEEKICLSKPAGPVRVAMTFALGTIMLTFYGENAAAQVAVALNSGPICSGGTVMLYETGGDAVSWVWSSSGTAIFNDNTLQSPAATNAVNGEVFTVLITDALGNASSATTTLTVFDGVPPRPGQVTGSETQCAGTTGVVYSIAPVTNATEYLWEMPEGVEIVSGQGTISVTVNIGIASLDATIRVSAINACGISPARTKNLSVILPPASAGSITGSTTYTPGLTGIAYSVAPIDRATVYIWTYSGTGVIINGNGASSVTIDFSVDATDGLLSVYGTNPCGEGTASGLNLTAASKTLTLSLVLLEGLYSGTGTMRQAWNETGPQYPADVADQVTVELHDASSYATVVWSQTGVALNTSGALETNVPSAYSGTYYITIRHRNSIETTSAQPVSFAGSAISHSFGTPGNVYGGNLRTSSDNYYLIFGGDANQDGSVDTRDYTPVVNDVSRYTRGYIFTDIDGSGTVDTDDYTIMVNNANRYVMTIHP